MEIGEPNRNLSSRTPTVVIIVFLLVVIVVLVIIIFRDSNEKVHVSKCAMTSGDFGLFHGKDGEPLTGCKDSHNCTYKANDISEAVNICNNLMCSAFSYHPIAQEMTIINPDKSLLKPSSETDSFFSQMV